MTIDRIRSIPRRAQINSAAAARSRKENRARRDKSPGVECLENRSLLSTVLLSGFPTHGFRSDGLGGTETWDVATVVDGRAEHAVAFAEGSEAINDAPKVSLESGEPVWLAGVIGDTLLRGAVAATNDVDIYRIELPGSDHFAVRLDVLAQRFGSGLDAAVSLFDGDGELLDTNDDALHDGYLSDSELFRGLDGGTYFVAVSAGGNQPGEDGFDPAKPGSGTGSRGSRGPYLLRVEAVPDSTRPQVAATNIADGATLAEPPTWITVRFTEPMNLAGLEAGATLASGSGKQLAITQIRYDSLTNEMTYLVLDRADAGDYEFTLHAAQVTDRADNPLDGGGPGGDFSVSFQVTDATPLLVDGDLNETADTAQSLGVLFERELRVGVRVSGVASPSAAGVATTDQDFYRIEVLRFNRFRFELSAGLPPGASVTLRDASGSAIARSNDFAGFGAALFRFLDAGEYFVQVSAPVGASAATYQLTISATAMREIPLTNNDPGASVQVVLRSNDGVVTPAVAESSVSTLVIANGEIVAAVNALPAVGTAPLGRPQAQAAGDGELAWLDDSPGGSSLPAGLTLHAPRISPAAGSVDRVSGSFLDALPDEIDHGTHALQASTSVIAEIAELMRGRLIAAAASRAAESGESSVGAVADEVLLDEADRATDNAPAKAVSTKTATLGMAVALSVASAATVPTRRRGTDWFQRAVEAIGMAS